MDEIFQQYGQLVASIGVGCATFTFGIAIIHVVFSWRQDGGEGGTFERERRGRLRSEQIVFRIAEPLIVELADAIKKNFKTGFDSLRQNLVIAREPLPWRPEEFLATKLVEGLLAGLCLICLLELLGLAWLGWIAGLLLIGVYPWLAVRAVADKARRRIQRLRIRLPFTIDLISLMMEAGASFSESLQTVVKENTEHPLGEELGEVERQIELGRTRADALRGMQQRLSNEDISELVFAINKGEELGTPITSVLRDQSDQMRVKRSQWGEKAAGEAQVQLVFPGMVVMVACLLVVVAPIILPALLQYLI